MAARGDGFGAAQALAVAGVVIVALLSLAGYLYTVDADHAAAEVGRALRCCESCRLELGALERDVGQALHALERKLDGRLDGIELQLRGISASLAAHAPGGAAAPGVDGDQADELAAARSAEGAPLYFYTSTP